MCVVLCSESRGASLIAALFAWSVIVSARVDSAVYRLARLMYFVVNARLLMKAPFVQSNHVFPREQKFRMSVKYKTAFMSVTLPSGNGFFVNVVFR